MPMNGIWRATRWPFIKDGPTRKACLLMAEIEEGQTGDQGKARVWLSRAATAPADPIWVADGVTSEDWAPVSPATGRLDAFAWKVPVTASTPILIETQDPPHPPPPSRHNRRQNPPTHRPAPPDHQSLLHFFKPASKERRNRPL